ncbi:unnamed protein product [Linum trigynum]|uniref:Uncharacterized protein n=1 Tax=Linum trigynum TaxID=586398 RepID=A0AAV2E838_9ROSI
MSLSRLRYPLLSLEPTPPLTEERVKTLDEEYAEGDGGARWPVAVTRTAASRARPQQRRRVKLDRSNGGEQSSTLILPKLMPPDKPHLPKL